METAPPVNGEQKQSSLVGLGRDSGVAVGALLASTLEERISYQYLLGACGAATSSRTRRRQSTAQHALGRAFPIVRSGRSGRAAAAQGSVSG